MSSTDGDLEAGSLGVGILCHPTYGGSGVVASELALVDEAGHMAPYEQADAVLEAIQKFLGAS